MRAKHGLEPDRTTILVSAGGFGVGPVEPLVQPSSSSSTRPSSWRSAGGARSSSGGSRSSPRPVLEA